MALEGTTPAHSYLEYRRDGHRLMEHVKRESPPTTYCGGDSETVWMARFCKRTHDLDTFTEVCWRPAMHGAELYKQAKDSDPLPAHTPILENEPLDAVRLTALRIELLENLEDELEAAGLRVTDKQKYAALERRYFRFGVYVYTPMKCPRSTICHDATDSKHAAHILCLKKAPNNVPAMDEWFEPWGTGTGVTHGFRKVDVKDLERETASYTANNRPDISIRRTWYIDREYAEASISYVAYNPENNQPIFPEVGGIVTFQDATGKWFDVTNMLFTHNEHCNLGNLFTSECPTVNLFHIKAGTYFQYTFQLNLKQAIMASLNFIIIDFFMAEVAFLASTWPIYQYGGKLLRWVPIVKAIYSGFDPDVGPKGIGPPKIPAGHGYEFGQGVIPEPHH